MSALTKRQSQILSLIRSCTQAQGYPPSYRELMQLLDLSSPATLHKHIQQLKALGHLKTLPRSWRNLKMTTHVKSHVKQRAQLAIIGSVSKGEKIELFAQASFFELPESLAPLTRTLYGFVVNDWSFSSLHMQRGDLLIVEARQEAQNGELVLAKSKDHGVQIGRYLVTYSERRLQSHIPEIDGQMQEMSLSFDQSELQIQGAIIALHRRYQFSSDSSSFSGSKSSRA